jgi:fructokinase
VEFDDKGNPSYQIAGNAAWDWLQWDPELEDLARRCDAVCFGSLAQREGQSRNLIYRFLDEARRAFKLFDVNLRKPHDQDQHVLRRSCERADAVKLNDQELPLVARMLGLEGQKPDEQAMSLLQRFKLKRVILTRGAQGTVMFTSSGRYEGEPVSYPAAANADAVGAGDACSAGILVGSVLRLPLEKVLALANHAGAFVASQPGATPTLPETVLNLAR